MMPTGAWTTTVRVEREVRDTSDANGYGDMVTATVADGVGAVIDFGSGARTTRQGGTFTTSTFTMACEQVDLRSGDVVVDVPSGQRFTVQAAFAVADEEQPHVQANLEQS